MKTAKTLTDIDPLKLKKDTDQLISAISSPQFVAAMKRMKETPMAERLALASKTLTPSALTEAGVNLPKGMRVTSRYFEPGSPDIIEVDAFGSRLRNVNSVPGSTAAWACACGGAATVCGGAGGGS